MWIDHYVDYAPIKFSLSRYTLSIPLRRYQIVSCSGIRNIACTYIKKSVKWTTVPHEALWPHKIITNVTNSILNVQGFGHWRCESNLRPTWIHLFSVSEKGLTLAILLTCNPHYLLPKPTLLSTYFVYMVTNTGSAQILCLLGNSMPSFLHTITGGIRHHKLDISGHSLLTHQMFPFEYRFSYSVDNIHWAFPLNVQLARFFIRWESKHMIYDDVVNRFDFFQALCILCLFNFLLADHFIKSLCLPAIAVWTPIMLPMASILCLPVLYIP